MTSDMCTIEAYETILQLQEVADYFNIDMDVFHCYRANANWSGWKTLEDLEQLQDRQLNCVNEVLESKVRYQNDIYRHRETKQLFK